MRVGIYTFSCRFETDALLPAFKGSTLRGGLGHALKHIVCALRRQECRTCLLASTCAYAFLFEVKDNNSSQRPHPYVLIPPDDEQRSWKAGDIFSFSIALFGRANDYLPHIVYAVQEMGREGLGKKTSAEGRYRLETIQQGAETIYHGEALHASLPLPELSLELPFGSGLTDITVTCQTPLRLKSDNQLQAELPFHMLIRVALRRISTLEEVYGAGAPLLDYKGLVARAADVHIVQSDCLWTDIKRYSSRQKTAMLLGGLKGRLMYQGDNLTEFLPLLRYCEVTNLGKQTSFGLGRIKVEAEEIA